jgi:hypothetical protein
MTTSGSGTAMGAIGGAAAGYVLWLAAFSIADDNSAVGQWAPMVLLLSAALAVCGLLGGLLLRWRGKYLWSGFGFGLPVLPVVLTLAVLADVHF